MTEDGELQVDLVVTARTAKANASVELRLGKDRDEPILVVVTLDNQTQDAAFLRDGDSIAGFVVTE